MSFKKVATILGTNIYAQHVEFSYTEYYHDVDGTKSLVLLMTINTEDHELFKHQGERNDFLHTQVSSFSFHHAVMQTIEGIPDSTDDLYNERKLGADPKYAQSVPNMVTSRVSQ